MLEPPLNSGQFSLGTRLARHELIEPSASLSLAPYLDRALKIPFESVANEENDPRVRFVRCGDRKIRKSFLGAVLA